MIATYTARSYSPDKVRARYVRRSGPGYRWCEAGEGGRDLRQGIAYASELPRDVRVAADRLAGQAFGYVEWPLSERVPA